MGRLRVLNDTREPDPESPSEWTTDGCPGAWYRCAWALSVSHYERLLTDGGFSENLHLTRSDDRLLLDAVAYLEMERIRARNNDDRKRAEYMRRQNGT
jgi:hypothetical protein